MAAAGDAADAILTFPKHRVPTRCRCMTTAAARPTSPRPMATSLPCGAWRKSASRSMRSDASGYLSLNYAVAFKIPLVIDEAIDTTVDLSHTLSGSEPLRIVLVRNDGATALNALLQRGADPDRIAATGDHPAMIEGGSLRRAAGLLAGWDPRLGPSG